MRIETKVNTKSDMSNISFEEGEEGGAKGKWEQIGSEKGG